MKYIFLLLISTLSFAQIPSYYNSIDFTESPAVVQANLANLITDTHTFILSYSQTWSHLMVTDQDPDNSNKVLLFYGYNDTDADITNDRTRSASMNGGNNGEWNREHVYPKSLGGFNTEPGPGTDLHMLRASDVQRNAQRGNLPFTYGTGVQSYAVNSGWYPGDEWKGDVARIIMYMYLRYGNQCSPNIVAINSSNSFHADMPDIFLTWNVEDPVSEVELDRNNYLETEIGNRNPFIDNPFLATYIWGGPDAENTWNLSVEELSASSQDHYFYPNPAKDKIFLDESCQSVSIFDVNGKLKMTSNSAEIPVNTLPKGVYLLQITLEDGSTQMHPLVKN